MKFKSYALFFLLFGILPDIFISVFLAHGWISAAVWLPTAVALFFLTLIRRGLNYTDSLKSFSYLIFIFEFPKLILSLVFCFSWSRIPALCAGIAVSLFFTVMIFIVTTNLKTNRSELFFRNLPPGLEGLRICHLGDFHLGSFGKGNPYIRRIVDAAMAESPDIILFSGDLVNFDSAEADSYMGELSRLKAPLGIFACRGNHDYLLHGHFTEEERERDLRRLLGLEESLGWKILLNENAVIKEGELAIAGVENISTNPYFPSMGGDLDKALAGIPEGTFTILLSHDPTHWKSGVVPSSNVSLTLSGHTHGLKFKLAGPHPSSWKFHENKGVYHCGDQILNVTAGLGSAFAFRLGGRPSVDILTLHRKQ